jgi:hypothetical protein
MMRFPSFEELPPTAEAAAFGRGSAAAGAGGTAQVQGLAAVVQSDSLPSAVTQDVRQRATKPLASLSQQPCEGDYPSPSEMLLEIPLEFPASSSDIGGSGEPGSRVTQARGLDDSPPAHRLDAATAYDTKAATASPEEGRGLKGNHGANRTGADVSPNGGPGSAATLSLPEGANTSGLDANTNGSGAFELL